MTERSPRPGRRHAARASRPLALGLSVGAFGALMTWYPVAARQEAEVALQAAPAATAAAPPAPPSEPPRVVRVVVRRKFVVTEGAPTGGQPARAGARAANPAPATVAPPPVAAPAPPPAPAPQPVASSRGSR